MRMTEATQRLGTSARMLRYRDSLGLLPAVRDSRIARTTHRQFTEEDLAAVSLALAIERRYDITPAALAFGLRVLTEPAVRADLAELGRRTGRIPAPPARALEFEKERALRLLGLPSPGRAGPQQPAPGRPLPGQHTPARPAAPGRTHARPGVSGASPGRGTAARRGSPDR